MNAKMEYFDEVYGLISDDIDKDNIIMPNEDNDALLSYFKGKIKTCLHICLLFDVFLDVLNRCESFHNIALKYDVNEGKFDIIVGKDLSGIYDYPFSINSVSQMASIKDIETKTFTLLDRHFGNEITVTNLMIKNDFELLLEVLKLVNKDKELFLKVFNVNQEEKRVHGNMYIDKDTQYQNVYMVKDEFGDNYLDLYSKCKSVYKPLVEKALLSKTQSLNNEGTKMKLKI